MAVSPFMRQVWAHAMCISRDNNVFFFYYISSFSAYISVLSIWIYVRAVILPALRNTCPLWECIKTKISNQILLYQHFRDTHFLFLLFLKSCMSNKSPKKNSNKYIYFACNESCDLYVCMYVLICMLCVDNVHDFITRLCWIVHKYVQECYLNCTTLFKIN